MKATLYCNTKDCPESKIIDWKEGFIPKWYCADHIISMKGGNKKMTEEQENLNIGIGNKEPEKLKPAEVTIAGVQIKLVGEKGHKKVVLKCLHPDKPNDPIEISDVKYEVDSEKLKIITTWYNKEKKTDEEKDQPDKLQKNSAIAHLMRFLGANTLTELEGKKCMTTTGERDYLVFKGY